MIRMGFFFTSRVIQTWIPLIVRLPREDRGGGGGGGGLGVYQDFFSNADIEHPLILKCLIFSSALILT